MKKITYSIALVCLVYFTSFAQCPGSPPPGYTCIPDANFEQALIDFGYDTEGTLDGQILTADCSSRPTLSIINRGVTDFTGIEAFVSITSLDVSYNLGLVSLNTSSNTLIESLDTEGCEALTTLDLSNNTALTNINLFDNDLSSLDLSNNLLLDTVDLRFNQLSSLDFSMHTLLTNVNVKNNMLTFFDMRNGNNASVTFFDADFNPGLECLFVDDASASYLTSLPWIIPFATTFVNNEGECNTLTVADAQINIFDIYPNPADNLINVAADIQSGQFELYNIIGKRVLSKSVSEGQNAIDVSNLSAGIYIAKLITNNRSESIKVIIN